MKRQKAITLIELISVIVVLSISIPVLMRMWANISLQAIKAEYIADATFYCQQLMEEVRSKRYDENEAPTWTNSSAFGVDSGETASNRSTYDDVDDYQNSTDPAVLNPASGFSRSVKVEYASLSGTDWVSCPAQTCSTVSTCVNCSECCFKRITVTVKSNNGALKDATLSTIVAGIYSQ